MERVVDRIRREARSKEKQEDSGGQRRRDGRPGGAPAEGGGGYACGIHVQSYWEDPANLASALAPDKIYVDESA